MNKILELYLEVYEKGREDAGMAAYKIAEFYTEKGNHKEAFEWYRKGAELGDDRAICELGDCYLMGMGVEKDLEKAQKCYQMAYKKQGAGAERAAEALWRIHRANGGTEEKEQFLRDIDLGNELVIRNDCEKEGENGIF